MSRYYEHWKGPPPATPLQTIQMFQIKGRQKEDGRSWGLFKQHQNVYLCKSPAAISRRSYLSGLLSCHCNNMADSFNHLPLWDDGEILYISCLQKVSGEERKTGKQALFFGRSQKSKTHLSTYKGPWYKPIKGTVNGRDKTASNLPPHVSHG